MRRFHLLIVGASLARLSSAYHEPEEHYQPAPQYPFGTSFPLTSTQPVPHHTWSGDIWAGTSMTFNPGATFTYTNSYFVPEHHYLPGDYNKIHDDHDDEFIAAPTPKPTPSPTRHPGEGANCGKLYGPQCMAMLYCQVTPGYNPTQTGTCIHIPEHDGGMGTEGWYPGATDKNPWVHVGNSHTAANSGGAFNPNSQGSCANSCGFQSITGSCWCDDECKKTGDCCVDIQAYCGAGAPITVAPGESTHAGHNHGLHGDSTAPAGTLGSMSNLNTWNSQPSSSSSSSSFYTPPTTFPSYPTTSTTPSYPTISTTPSYSSSSSSSSSHDGHDHGSTSTTPSYTPTTTTQNMMPNAYSANGSCQGKCGEEITMATGKCWCDMGCKKYNDCCSDIMQFCS